MSRELPSLAAHARECGGLNAALSLGFTLTAGLSRVVSPVCLECSIVASGLVGGCGFGSRQVIVMRTHELNSSVLK